MQNQKTRQTSVESRKNRLRHLLYVLTCAIICIVYFLDTSASALEKSLSKTSQVQKKQIDRLEEGISKQEAKLAKNQEQELFLYDELQRIDTKLQEQQQKLLTSQKSLLRQESFLETKEIEFNLLKEDKENAQIHIKNRLRSFYQTGEIGIINTLFSASTLPDLLNTKEYFHSLFQYDLQAIKKYKNKLALLDGARAEMLKGKETLLATIVEIKDQEKGLITLRQERSKHLTQIKTEKSLYEQALAEMQKAAEILIQKINLEKSKPTLHPKKKKIIKSATKRKPLKRIAAKDFAYHKGKLPPPIEHGTIFSYFGKSKGVFGVELDSKGIDIQVEKESEVKAVYKGTIVFAGELQGYGNMVIIDHGQQYFTLASQMNKIYAKKGTKIQQGETLGIIEKEQSGLLQKGLHFEVRSGSTPQDPLLWLDKSRLSLGSIKQ